MTKRGERAASQKRSMRGSVLVVVLWTLTLLSILVAVIASQVRLSAQAARLHREDLQEWAALSSALNQAEMELVLSRMAPSVESQELEDLGRPEQLRFNGEPLTLHYPQDPNVVVRIYDHSGKINLRNPRNARMRELLMKKLGEDADPAQVNALMSAWRDWTDLNDGAAADGAEAEYYLSLDPPYRPRNGPIETVEEILLIKGFAEVFADVDLDAAFTVYESENSRINLNVATVEAMRLLPGLDDELIRIILDYRRENTFGGNGDIAQLIPAESMAVLRPWLVGGDADRSFSSFYTILVYPRLERPDEEGVMQDVATTALGEVVQLTGTERPRVFKINPYQRIPLRTLPPEPEE